MVRAMDDHDATDPQQPGSAPHPGGAPRPGGAQQQPGGLHEPVNHQVGGAESARTPPYSDNPYRTTTMWPPVEPPRKRGVSAGIVAVALVAGLVGGGVGVGGTLLLDRDSGSSSAPVLTQHDPATGTDVSAQQGTVQYAANKAAKSTVDISVTTRSGQAEGTGVVLTKDGYVLTNNHVVSSGHQITVTLPDGSKSKATVKGVAPSYDIAVLKLDNAANLVPAELGTSSKLTVGQTAVAIGSPLGLAGTVTSGIISALDRTVEASGDSGQPVVYNGIQTDASINHGNSGGPLVNLDGQVIGINSSIQSADSGSSGQGGGNIGLGFAIPVDSASRVAGEIIRTGSATKPQLGIMGTDSQAGNAQISRVNPGSAAERAGLKPGETILKVNGKAVTAFTDLIAQVGANAPGAKVQLTVGDPQGANPRQVEVTLDSAPDRQAVTVQQPSGGGQFPFGGGEFPFGGGSGEYPYGR